MKKLIWILLVSLLMIGIGNSVFGLTVTVKCTENSFISVPYARVELYYRYMSNSMEKGDFEIITADANGLAIFTDLPNLTWVQAMASKMDEDMMGCYSALSKEMVNVSHNIILRCNKGNYQPKVTPYRAQPKVIPVRPQLRK